MRKAVLIWGWVLLLAVVFLMPVARANVPVKIIPYKISSKMWYVPLQGGAKSLITTPQSVINKIKKVFELWVSVKEAGLEFRYDGLVDASYAGFHQIPHDGSVYIVLNNWDIGQCADGLSHAGLFVFHLGLHDGFFFLDRSKPVVSLR